ncbi:MAG: TlpA disulfide reductase family protein [Myxococcales bacterium]|nr:TlpA family protein disulfide reductase [Myxococcota bacterium]MDW8282367.1 TlpA disulfide reductase family protein [Myxococcales bacterium]
MRTGVLLAVLLLGVVPAWAGQQRGRPAADFVLPDGAGQTVRLSSLRGTVVVIDFWASWCEPCMRELPELDRLQKEFAGKVVVLPVSIDKERSEALATARRLRLGLRVLLDTDGRVVALYDPPRMPTSYVVDRQGVVRYMHEGFDGPRDIARLRRELEELTR